MYNILIAGSETPAIIKIKADLLYSRNSHLLDILTVDSLIDAHNYVKNKSINLFIFDISEKYEKIFNYILKLRNNQKYAFIPIILISRNPYHMIYAFKELYCLDYILEPFCENYINKTLKFINYEIQKNEYQVEKHTEYLKFFQADTFFNIPLDSIYFIEADKRKCHIYSEKDSYCISVSIQKILELSQNSCLMQSHRSYIVNIQKIKKISKSQNTWTVYFNDFEKTASLSRNFKKEFIGMISK